MANKKLTVTSNVSDNQSATTTATVEEVVALNLKRESYKAYKVKGWKKSKADGLKNMPDVSIRLVKANGSDVVIIPEGKYIYRPCFSVIRISAMGCTFDVTVNKVNPDKLYFAVTRDFDEEYEEQAAEVKKAPLKAGERFIRERLTKVGLNKFDELLNLAFQANGLKIKEDRVVWVA